MQANAPSGVAWQAPETVPFGVENEQEALSLLFAHAVSAPAGGAGGVPPCPLAFAPAFMFAFAVAPAELPPPC
jgi:hypothetical protein